jgi:arsenical pump membrane protein
VTPWASLATLIWFERVTATGENSVSVLRLAATGTVTAIAASLAATAVLVVTGA